VEFGFRQWLFGLSTYAFLDDVTIACIVADGAVARLHLLDTDVGVLEDPGLLWRSFLPPVLSSNGRRLLFVASSPTEPASVAAWEPHTADQEVLRRAFTLELDPDLFSVPEPITFPTADGEAHGLYYPPLDDVLRLSPVFPSPTHHGYDATDYFSVEPRLGTDADQPQVVFSSPVYGKVVTESLGDPALREISACRRLLARA
jgi:hypothetical protein